MKAGHQQTDFVLRFPPSVCALCRNGDMDWNDAALLMEIVAMSHAEGYCWASNGYFARGQINVRTVKRRLYRLIADGWIASNNGTGGSRQLYPNHEKLGADAAPLRSTPKSEEVRSTNGTKSEEVRSTNGTKSEEVRSTFVPPSFQKWNEARSIFVPQKKRKINKRKETNQTVDDEGHRHRVASSALTKERGTIVPSEKPKTPERKQSLKLRSTSKPVIQPEAQATPDDSRFAVILRDAILGAGYQLPRTSPDRPLKHESWISEFRKLRDIDKIAQPRIESVLTAYCQHITDEFAPQAWSGKSFRAKFAAIERFAKIKSADTPATPECEDLDADADAIEIEKWNWPAPIRKGDLSQSVQTARTFGTSLWKQCRAMRGEDASFDVFLDSILEQRSEAFTLRWHKWVLASVQNWEAWSGSLKKFAASASHPLFRKWIMKLSKEQTCQDADGKRFLRNMEDAA